MDSRKLWGFLPFAASREVKSTSFTLDMYSATVKMSTTTAKRPMMSICMELSPSIPSQRFSCWVPRVKMPMMSSTPRATK